jgi:predicted PhzF superfamily epimerase YddE/YHI9
MSSGPVLHILRVFCDERGRAGNLLGVFPDGGAVPAARRQGIARQLGFSETVFVVDMDTAGLEIYTPARELPFAGHPLVGTAWLLGRDNPDLSVLRPPAGDVRMEFHEQLVWVHARAEYSPHWDSVRLDTPESVLELKGPPGARGHVQAWAWQDEEAGVVRARVFAEEYGVPEDPATGSAAIVLCAALGRGLRIIQGRADTESEIRVRPLADGWFALGGRVVVDRPPEPFQLQG